MPGWPVRSTPASRSTRPPSPARSAWPPGSPATWCGCCVPTSQRDPELLELRGRLVRDQITDAYLARELAGGQPLDPAELAAEVGTTTTVARQWLHTLRAGQQSDPRLGSLRAEPVSHGRPTAEQLAALQAAYADGGRPQVEDSCAGGSGRWSGSSSSTRPARSPAASTLDPAAVAREVGVSEHYVRGTLVALRGGTLTNAQRIEQLWRLWEAEGGQRLAVADVARLVGVREGRVRQVLGPLRTAHRNATRPSGRAERPPVVVEDDGRQGWLDQAACRDLDPERFFPESGRAGQGGRGQGHLRRLPGPRSLPRPGCQGRWWARP